jgi:hypothetical protein
LATLDIAFRTFPPLLPSSENKEDHIWNGFLSFIALIPAFKLISS